MKNNKTTGNILKLLTIMVTVLVSGCAGMYTLPAAPPESEWKVAEKPQESQEVLVRRFLDAKRAAIQCYAALADGNWEGALEWMSSDTVVFFVNSSNGEGATAVFEKGEIFVDGEKTPFDPVGDVFIRGLNDIRDDFGNRTDDEGPERKVLYAVSSSGQAREIVFVYENNKWLLERTQFQSDLLTE